MEIVERNTGYTTVLNALRDNGSPYPTFTMDTGRTYLTVTLPVHPYFLPKVADNDKKALYQTKILEALGDKAMSKNELAQAMSYKGISAKTIAGSRNNASKRHIEASADRVDSEDLQEVTNATHFDGFDGVRRTLSKVSIFLVEGFDKIADFLSMVSTNENERFDKIAYHDKKITPCRVALRTG